MDGSVRVLMIAASTSLRLHFFSKPKTSQSAHTVSHVPPERTNNEIQRKAALLAQTSNGPIFPWGSLPCSGNERVGSLCHWQNPFAQNAGAKLGGEGHARSEFRHVYITAQDISQSPAKLLKFPGSRVVEC